MKTSRLLTQIFLLLTLIFIAPLVSAASGDILLQDNGTGIVSDNWQGGAFVYDSGVINITCCGVGDKNMTGLYTTGAFMLNYEFYDPGDSIGTSQYWSFGFHDFNGGDHTFSELGTGVCDALQTTYNFYSDDCGGSMVTRATGWHTVSILLNFTSGQAEYTVDGVNYANDTGLPTGGFDAIQFTGNIPSIDWKLDNIMLCEDYCNITPPEAPFVYDGGETGTPLGNGWTNTQGSATVVYNTGTVLNGTYNVEVNSGAGRSISKNISGNSWVNKTLDFWMYDAGQTFSIIGMGSNLGSGTESVYFERNTAVETSYYIIGGPNVNTITNASLTAGWRHVQMYLENSSLLHVYVDDALSASITDDYTALLPYVEFYDVVGEGIFADDINVYSGAPPTPPTPPEPANETLIINSLVNYWDGDGATCEEDRQGKNANLTTTNGAQCLNTGVRGKGYDLNTTTSWTSANTGAPTGNNDLTMCAWINIKSPLEYISSEFVVGYGNFGTLYEANGFGWSTGGTPQWLHGGGDFAAHTYNVDEFGSDQWEFFCQSYNATTGEAALYRNGTYDTSSFGNVFDFGGAILNTSLSLGLMSGFVTPNVTVDNIGVWNRVLSDTEIEYLWNGSSGAVLFGQFTPPPILNATLTVFKIVVNDDNGSLTVGDFSLFINSTPTTNGTAVSLTPGTYQVSETPETGYTGTISGDCAPNGLITLAQNQSATCTITNNDNPVIIPPVEPDEFDEEFTSTFNAVIALFVILLLFAIGFVWADKNGYVSDEVRKYFWSITGFIVAVIILGLLFV